MKTITIVIPTYNEEANIPIIYERVVEVFRQLSSYQYNILYIDNYSTDQSRNQIRLLCNKDPHVQAIFNARNFGFSRSTFYGMTQVEGEAVVLLFADMQDPPEVVLDFISEWEKGYKIVVGVKNKSLENPLMYCIRGAYYKLLGKIADIDHIHQFTGFGLYDRSFIEVLRSLDDPLPYLRGIVAELGFMRKEIKYEQNIRKHGKTNFNFFRLYDVAMLGITSYSKALMRCATFVGSVLSLLCVIVSVVTLLIKLLNWEYFSAGTATIVIGVFFIGAIQLLFTGLLGEYIMNMNTRIMHRPLVIEEERINFNREKE